MTILGTYLKQPDERLDVDLDFTDWLDGRDGDTLAAATSTVTPAAELVVEAPIVASPTVKQFFSAGVDGTTYKVSVTVTTAQGRIKQVEFRVKVREI